MDIFYVNISETGQTRKSESSERETAVMDQ